MKKYLFSTLFLLLAFTFASNAQILQPVKWSFESKQVSNDEFELLLKADMDPGWHIYGMDTIVDGPIPTSFRFISSEHYELLGKLAAPKPIEDYDKILEMDLKYFEHGAIFSQKVKVKSDKPSQVKGELEFMACNDRSCLPPEVVEFAFDLPGVTAGRSAKTPEKAGDDAPVQVSNEEKQQSIMENQAEPVTTIQAETSSQVKSVTVNTDEDQTPAKEKSTSLWAFFFLALGVGFIGLLTPCVYPMIPMTVTFFMNASQNKLKAKSQAVFFGLSIIFIYTIIGILVSVLFGADTIKQVSEHWVTNVIFFLLFAFFAASFFGMFELVLPTWLTNKSDQQADKGGYIGAFFMALTLVLVSFSCTAPFVGGILVEAATGQVIKPTVGMFGFSLAFGIVFTILALFPSFLNKMPKSGGWLNSVKVVLAFLILAIGMKYMNVPNQALGWGITREVFIAVWIVLFVLLGFYLLGKIRFSHDSPVDHIAVPRLLMVILAFTFAIYLVPGLFGAPLKAVSGYLPSESAWDLDDIIRESTRNISGANFGSSTPAGLCDAPKYADRFDLPHGLQGYFDYEQGLACAKKLNKPVFLDIKGHACTNCKVMEKNVWSAPEVLKRLQNDYVIIALYVDDNYELPENEWITSTFDGKVKKTIGRKNTDFQITRFGVNAQPYYVLMDNNGNTLVPGIGFEPNIASYVSFLDKGLEEFKKLKP
jgi:thiol:disulfide interchange protein DsbD